MTNPWTCADMSELFIMKFLLFLNYKTVGAKGNIGVQRHSSIGFSGVVLIYRRAEFGPIYINRFLWLPIMYKLS